MPKKNMDEVTFSNYNYSFNIFFTQYKILCESIISKRSITEINRDILTFVSSFNYAIVTEERRHYFVDSCYSLYYEANSDSAYQEIVDILSNLRAKGKNDFSLEIKFYRKYYTYLIRHLILVGEVSREMSYTFMPHTGIQKKYLSYFNSQSFYERFSEFQNLVTENIRDFGITNFMRGFNSILIYYYAYRLFIDEETVKRVEAVLSVILSSLFEKTVVDLIGKYPNYTEKEREKYRTIEKTMVTQMYDCVRMINMSFSRHGILPRVNKKVYTDTTLI